MTPRAKPRRVKKRIIRQRGFKNMTLQHEDLLGFEYKPRVCARAYRVVALRQTILVEKGQLCLGTEIRYHFYITNDRSLSLEEVVRESNDRCNQERLVDQLKHGARALHAPLNNLVANNAYMVMAALAWSSSSTVNRRPHEMIPSRRSYRPTSRRATPGGRAAHATRPPAVGHSHPHSRVAQPIGDCLFEV